MSAPTPYFGRPPVIEVAVGVQFADPLPLRIVDYGRLQEVFGPRYPDYVEQPALGPVLEAFGPDYDSAKQERGPADIFPRSPFRLWFSNGSNGSLVQVQADRFIFNWRIGGSNRDYPRFSWVHSQFRTEYTTFLQALSERGIPEPMVELCEVTYVNHIQSGDGWKDHGEIAEVFPSLGMPALSWPGASPEDADFRMRFAMEDSSGGCGRLHISIVPAIRSSDDVNLFIATLIARNRPELQGAAAVIQALQDGHDWVVSAFRDVTSPTMHRVWELKNGPDDR